MRDSVRFLSGVLVHFTLSVLGVGISRERLHQFREAFRGLDIVIFAVNPEPTVQVIFSEEFDDDAVIFRDAEQFREGEDHILEDPDASCYVVARSLPAYRASVFLQE
jgi:hypothetical protein